MGKARQAGLGLAAAVFVAMPVAAGALGHASLAMLAFAGMFLIANAVMRPETVRLDEPGLLALQAVTAGAFAALLVGLGQTIRALAQIEARAELFGLVFVAAWALVLARLVWRRATSERIARGAETALRSVHRSGHRSGDRSGHRSGKHSGDLRGRDPGTGRKPAASPPDVEAAATDPEPAEPPKAAPSSPPPSAPSLAPFPAPPPATPALAQALARLDRLPASGADPERLQSVLETLSGAAPPGDVFATLLHRAGPQGTERDRRALVRHATDPWVAERREGHGEPAQAFEAIVAAADAAALAEFATLSLALLDDLPHASADLPTVPRLLEIADQIEAAHDTEAELLISLAHSLEDLALAAEADAENGADA